MAGADKFIGVSLYAARPVKKEKPIGKTIAIFKKGDFVGIIDSWVVRNGKIYWLMYENNQFNPLKSYYVEQQDGNFVKTQQIKRIIDLEEKKQKIKEQAELQKLKDSTTGDQSLLDKLGEGLKQYFPWIIVAALAGTAIRAYINKKA